MLETWIIHKVPSKSRHGQRPDKCKGSSWICSPSCLVERIALGTAWISAFFCQWFVECQTAAIGQCHLCEASLARLSLTCVHAKYYYSCAHSIAVTPLADSIVSPCLFWIIEISHEHVGASYAYFALAICTEIFHFWDICKLDCRACYGRATWSVPGSPWTDRVQHPAHSVRPYLWSDSDFLKRFQHTWLHSIKGHSRWHIEIP